MKRHVRRILAPVQMTVAVIAAWASGKVLAQDEWSVMNPPHLTRTAQVDVDEGTWMNLDVSPDGKSIAFDFLGDIYIMPVSSGAPRQLLAGLAWETQPRFSPDGASLVFVSDRSGVKNLWTYRLRDASLQQVTDERFRTPSTPAWSPDGKFIIARKHYTTRRTIGAGEIWRFPAVGGVGERLVEGESGQKDITEPVHSPDGKAIYFTKDTDPGLEFQYERDIHKGFLSILKLDLGSQRQTTVVSGPGGAIRPMPSPDGKWLAYVTRIGVDAQSRASALVLRDLRSGEERVLDNRLDEDLQELWANDGYYPAFAWLPRGDGLVYWARGKIWRVSIAGGNASEIAFRIKARHELVQTPPRAPVRLDGTQFAVKALRSVSVSADGRLVTYQALGKIYLRDQISGAVRRLTKNTAIHEFFPAFSPDGQWVVYTTWDERELGSLRRTHVQTGETVVLSREPAHYVEPVVARGGTSIVFRKAPKGRLLDPRWTQAPGLHEVPWQGGDAQRVNDEARAPQVCDQGRALYATVDSPHQDKPPASYWMRDRKLVRIHEGGSVSAPLATGLATEYKLSADCRWLARAEQGEIIVTRLVTDRLGNPIDAQNSARFVAPGDGGAYLSWSRDGTLHWALGPTLFSWRFDGNGPTAAPTRTEIGFDAPVTSSSGPLALRGGRIVTMRGTEIIADGTVVIRDGRITAVGPASQVAVPADARVIELNGRTVVPGLFDNHAHAGPAGHHEQGLQPRQNWGYYALLALGVTTIFDPSADYSIFASGELSRAGLIVAPRIFSTGPPIHDVFHDNTATINDLNDARKYVRRVKAHGAIAVKSYLLARRAQRQQLVEAARLEGVSVVDEAQMGIYDTLSLLLDGNTSIEHGIFLAHVYADVEQLWSQADSDLTPTFPSLGGRLLGYLQERVWEHPILSRYVPPSILRADSIRPTHIQPEELHLVQTARWLERLAKQGVRVLPSGHGEREGLGVHWDMRILAEGGMRPFDLLAAATIRSAEHLGLAADLGSIEIGKLADLVVMEGDPLTDIRDAARVHAVISQGRYFDPMKMDDEPGKPRAPFYWEKGR